jgi:APA family basic amino acid/polyamine antiporter
MDRLRTDENQLGHKPDLRSGSNSRVLPQRVGLIEVTFLGAGTAMGVSIFSVLAPAASVAGSGLLITTLLAAAPMGLFSLVYAFMASALPKSGASYEWPKELISPAAGFAVAWLRIMASIGNLITISLVLVQYGSMAIHLPIKASMFVILTAVFAVNFFGVQVATRFQAVAMVLLLATLTLFVATGAPHVSLERIGSPFAHGWLPIIAALPLMIQLFLGIETASEIGEEVRRAEITIPLALALAMAMILIVYLLVSGTALGLMGPTRLAHSTAPLIDAGALSMGRFAKPLILTAAAVSLLKSLNSIFLVFSRYLFAMGRSGVFPAVLGRLSAQGTPRAATIAAFGVSCAGLLMPQNLLFLTVAIAIPTLFKYGATCISALRLLRHRPELWERARLKFNPALIRAAAKAGLVCAVAVFLIGAGTDWRPYAMVAAWGLLGVAYWQWKARRERTRAERG